VIVSSEVSVANERQRATDALRGTEPGRRKKVLARRRRRVRVLTATLVAIVAGAIVMVAWPKPVPVEEATVRRGELEVTVDEAGKTRVRDRYVVYAPLAGNLARIELRAGDAVTVGAPLAQLMPASPALLDPRARAEASARVGAAEAAAAQANAQVARAEAAAEHAANDLETTRRLVASGSVSAEQERNAALDANVREKEAAAARFGAQVALNDVTVERAALRRYGDQQDGREPFKIVSPISGRVLRVDQQSASVVASGAALIELGDPSSLEVVVDVLTADAVRIPVNARVRLERWGGDVPLRGHVRVVEPSAFTKISALGVEEQRTNVVIDIDDPREVWARLGDGYRIEAHVVTWQGAGVVAVPASATFRQGDAWAAFVDDGGRARLRIIRIGQRSATEVQIESGLSPGERVIVHPSSTIVDGVRTRLR
jgi:HlyD family secretion protein